jgi:hypothetical protein
VPARCPCGDPGAELVITTTDAVSASIRTIAEQAAGKEVRQPFGRQTALIGCVSIFGLATVVATWREVRRLLLCVPL